MEVGSESTQGDVSETLGLAISLMDECKAELSLPNLDTVIFLLRELLERCPSLHPLHGDIVSSLVSALGIRFLHSDEREDLEELEKFGRITRIQATDMVDINDQDDDDMNDTLGMAKESLKELHPATSLSAIETILFLIEQSASLLSSSESSQAVAHQVKAYCLFTRFHHLNDITDLYDAISCLRQNQNIPIQSEKQVSEFFKQPVNNDGLLDLPNALLPSLRLRVITPTENRVNEDRSLLEFGSHLVQQFEVSGNLNDLDEGISLIREGLKDVSERNPDYATGLHNLADALQTKFDQRGDDMDLDEAISLFRKALDLKRSLSNSKSSGTLNSLATALHARFKRRAEDADLDEAIMLHRQVLELRPIGHPGQFMSLNNLANALLTRFNRNDNGTDVDEAITLHRQALELRPLPHPERSGLLSNLANAFYARFEHGKDNSDMDEAISLYRQALNLTPPPHPDCFDPLNNLATVLHTRSEQEDDGFSLEEAILLHRQALELCPPHHPKYFGSLNNLASALHTRFKQGGELIYLDETIALYREVVKHSLRGRPKHSDFTKLAIVLHTRFEQIGEESDLDESILLHRQALEICTPTLPDRSGLLISHGQRLWTRFERRGDHRDLDEAIVSNEEALKLTVSQHPSRFGLLSLHGKLLRTRFEQQGKKLDLDAAVSAYREAVELTTPRHSDCALSFTNLATSLHLRFQQQGNGVDLDEAIALNRHVLELTPLPHQDHPNSLSNLGHTLWTRFERQGDELELDESISLLRQALEIRPPPDPDCYGTLRNLANALFTRFRQRQNDLDVDEVISLHRQALEIGPPTEATRYSALSDLANALWARFQQRRSGLDLDEAVSLSRQALALTPPPHPNRFNTLNNLAAVLQARFEQTREESDLHEAISLNRQTLELCPPPHPKCYMSLNNLAATLSIRYGALGRDEDLNEAISLYQQSLDLFSPGHINRFMNFRNLGRLHIAALGHVSDDSRRPHLEQAMSALSQATRSIAQSPSDRFLNARLWAQHADLHEHPSALAAYDAVVDILPQMGALGLDINSRQNVLTRETDGLARKAARCAIRARSLGQAVEYLEAGRGVFWSQFLHLRSPFDQLHDRAPELERNLRRIALELERGSHRNAPNSDLSNGQKLSLEKEATHFEHLSKEWSDTLDKARKVDGFADFLRPLSMSKLQGGAKEHPVVYLVANDSGSDCLIITLNYVHHISLPSLSTKTLSILVMLLRIATSEIHAPGFFLDQLLDDSASLPQAVKTLLHRSADVLGNDRGMRLEGRLAYKSSDEIFQSVLRALWDEVVKPVIDFMGIEKSDVPPTLKWCPTGLFTFLPMHAAGRYTKEAVDCASDYIISSYIPSIGAILNQEQQPTGEPFKMLAVIQSRTLPATVRELEKIELYVPSDSLIKFGVPGEPASVDIVASKLHASSIVHFACHGIQDPNKPLDSGLEIEHERLTISRIMKETVPNGSLAVLSACETAKGDEGVPDEAMSLAAGLLFSGFRSVVATMWKMWDEDGPMIADAFYRELFKGSDGTPMTRPDTSKSAQALHVAVRGLRSQGVPFKRWVPFIHMGK